MTAEERLFMDLPIVFKEWLRTDESTKKRVKRVGRVAELLELWDIDDPDEMSEMVQVLRHLREAMRKGDES